MYSFDDEDMKAVLYLPTLNAALVQGMKQGMWLSIEYRS